MKYLFFLLLSIACVWKARAQQIPIPAVYANLRYDSLGRLTGKNTEGKTILLQRRVPRYTLSGVSPLVEGFVNGLRFRFTANGLRKGKVIYGLIPYGQHNFPMPVFRFEAPIDSAVCSAQLNIRNDLREGFDHTGWQKSGRGVIGYRLIDARGAIIYEGKQAFSATAAGFTAEATLLRGPFVSELSDRAVTIWFDTDRPLEASVLLDGQNYSEQLARTRHEFVIKGLKPDTEYRYTAKCGTQEHRYRFRTAPAPGSKSAFTFAFASDSRSGYGGGERNVYGVNTQIMQRIAALSVHEKSAFMQFTGDQADGYAGEPDDLRLQAVNWIQAVEPWWHYMPFNVGMGNHEALGWSSPEHNNTMVADGFPFETHSAEALFGEVFVHPFNGPSSEDGSRYDPDPYKRGDFPSYSENVYAYTYGNTAMLVLNSGYWFAPIISRTTPIGGNLHGYIMDEQLKWLAQTLEDLEKDRNIQHVFVTLHTAPFPNGGHKGDCMWYNGNNDPRAIVSGKPVDKGILERRDEVLDLCVNKSSKMLAFLCGHEHNYNRMRLSEETPRYPENWDKPNLKLRRPIWQIINGAAGAPFYAQEKLPWSAFVEGFTVQNALCLFDVKGKRVTLRVINPDTLEEIDRVKLR